MGIVKTSKYIQCRFDITDQDSHHGTLHSTPKPTSEDPYQHFQHYYRIPDGSFMVRKGTSDKIEIPHSVALGVSIDEIRDVSRYIRFVQHSGVNYGVIYNMYSHVERNGVQGYRADILMRPYYEWVSLVPSKDDSIQDILPWGGEITAYLKNISSSEDIKNLPDYIVAPTVNNAAAPIDNDQSRACPSYRDTCTGNLNGAITRAFAAAGPGNQIDNEDLDEFYNIANIVANDRAISTVSEPGNIANNHLVDDNDYMTLKYWVDSVVSTVGSTEYETSGSVIDASGWFSIRDKLKNVATLCNDINHCSCNTVCSCDTVCTCNCDSNY